MALMILVGLIVAFLFGYWLVQMGRDAKRVELEKELHELMPASIEVPDLGKCIEETSQDRYINYARILEIEGHFGALYARVHRFIGDSKKEKDQLLLKFDRDYTNRNQFIREHNQAYKRAKLEEHKVFFDTVLQYPLDDQQRVSIVSECENVLVVSSAGSGKTSSIVGKVQYLIQKQHVDPRRILLISYTNKAAAELTDRMAIPGLRGYTFHKLAIDIIGETTKVKPSVCDNTDRLFIEIFSRKCRDVAFQQSVLSYFLEGDPEDEKERIEREMREQLLEQKSRKIRALLPDMNGNPIYVRSKQEAKICYFLSSLGVKFLYEESYPVKVADENHSQYRPDFTIHIQDGDEERLVHLELFGVDKRGNVPPWFAQDRGISYEEANKRYGDGMTWKRWTHKKYGTTLVEMSSGDFSRSTESVRDLLRARLERAGVPIREVPTEELYENILPHDSMEEKTFIRLIVTFISLLKTNCLEISQVLDRVTPGDARSLNLILNIFKPIYDDYTELLKAHDMVDFADLIRQATRICEEQHPRQYDYIIVDEFQDISMDRYQFLLALRNNPGLQSNLYCVGDDWQSIYRFSGSDINLFSHFSDYFGPTDTCKIETTYRFGQPLVDISAQFIQRNPEQLRKNIHPFRSDARTILKYQHHRRYDFMDALTSVISAIPEGKSIFLLGRYSFDDMLLQQHVKPEMVNGKCFYTILGRRIEFLTVHKSKGLEADYVILLQCNRGIFGFPSAVSDDAVLNYVLSKVDSLPYAEERRLFYVAITRARYCTTIMYEQYNSSQFVYELQNPDKFRADYQQLWRKGERWSRKEDATLIDLYVHKNMPIREISKKMGRSQTGIMYRIKSLGIARKKENLEKALSLR